MTFGGAVRRYDVATPHPLEALRLSTAPWAVGTGARTLAAAAIIALAGVAFGDPASLGVAYFAASISVLFAADGTYRARLSAMAMQAVGAVAGIAVGAATGPTFGVAVVVAASMALIAGMVSVIGPAFSAFSLLLVVGTAYAQFEGSSLPIGTQCLWYLIGSIVVAAIVGSETIASQPKCQRAAISAVMGRAATVLDTIGSTDAAHARRDLADAARDCDDTLYGYRFVARRGSQAVDAIEAAAQTARRVTLVVTALYARGLPVASGASALLRAAAAAISAGRPVQAPDVDAADDPAVRMIVAALAAPARHPSLDETNASRTPALKPSIRTVMSTAARRESVASGLRLALCMAAATAAAASLHGVHHAFWLPLTVAVVVRPEVQSVFVRVVNRIVGSVIGSVLAAALLLTAPSTWALAVGAAVAMGLSVLAAPKMYGLFVIGITASTLLSATIGEVEPLTPELRVVESLVGCAIAIVVGYVLLPRQRFLSAFPHAVTTRLVAAYLAAGADLDVPSSGLIERRRDAQDGVQALRRSLQSAVFEPAVLNPRTRADLQVVYVLEDIVDDITDLALHVRRTDQAPSPELLHETKAAILTVGTRRATLSENAVVMTADVDDPIHRIQATIATLSP